MANALLGNFSGGVTGTAVATTTVGAAQRRPAAGFIPAGVTVRISGGGLGAAQDITFDSASNTMASAITDLSNEVDLEYRAQGGRHHDQRYARRLPDVHQCAWREVECHGDGRHANVLGLGTFVAGAGNAADYDAKTAGASTTYDQDGHHGSSFRSMAAISNGGTFGLGRSGCRRCHGEPSQAATADSDQHGKTSPSPGWRSVQSP